MTWTKLDDHFLSHPKHRRAGAGAMLLHTAALIYSNRHSTDGFVPNEAIPLLASIAWLEPDQITETLARLAHQDDELGPLWQQVDGGWKLHDFLDYNPSAEEVKRRRQQTSDRQKQWRDRHLGNGVTNALETAPRPVPVPVPDPDPAGPSVRIARAHEDGQTDEISTVLSLLGHDETPIKRAFIATIAAGRPDTDPAQVASDFARYQERQRALLARGSHHTRIYDDALKGWRIAMDSASERGLFQRRAPPDEPPPPTELEPTGCDPWDQARAEVLASLGPRNFELWIQPLTAELHEGTLTLVAPDPYIADWARTTFTPILQAALDTTGHSALTLSITTRNQEPA